MCTGRCGGPEAGWMVSSKDSPMSMKYQWIKHKSTLHSVVRQRSFLFSFLLTCAFPRYRFTLSVAPSVGYRRRVKTFQDEIVQENECEF